MVYTPLLLAWSFIALAAAQGNSQCTTGQIVCCSRVQSAYSISNLSSTTGMSNSAAADLGLVGSSCTTLTVIGLGKSCATRQLPVCCTDNNYNGAVSLGCSYINPMFT